ncbi:importin-11 isoform 2 [Silurus meridionalis]|nr:importin-11 isoform 2 [Silurus meridionalis]
MRTISDSKAENLEAHRIKSDFFTHSTLSEMCKRLVCKYLLLTQEELNMWEEDPESFAVEETGGDSWKYSLRKQPCTEVLFLDLFHNYSQILTPVLLDMVHTLRGVSDGEDSVQMLMKDSDSAEWFIVNSGEWQQQKEEYDDIVQWWEVGKAQIRMFCQNYTASSNNLTKSTIKALKKEIAKTQDELINKDSGKVKEKSSGITVP